MHPATPLIPAIWSSSKHAGDVKIPHLDVGEQQAPVSKWMGWGKWRRVENGGVRQEGCWGGWGPPRRWRWWRRGWGVGSGMCHPHILAALLLINFSHDRLWSQIHKTWEGGLNACTPYHPCCHSTPLPCYREMSIAFLICLLLPLWPLLYAFDEGLPKMCPFFTLAFSCFGRQSAGIKLYICVVTSAVVQIFCYLSGYYLKVLDDILLFLIGLTGHQRAGEGQPGAWAEGTKILQIPAEICGQYEARRINHLKNSSKGFHNKSNYSQERAMPRSWPYQYYDLITIICVAYFFY